MKEEDSIIYVSTPNLPMCNSHSLASLMERSSLIKDGMLRLRLQKEAGILSKSIH